MQALGGIKFLEEQNLIHGSIVNSNILLNQEGEVKISTSLDEFPG